MHVRAVPVEAVRSPAAESSMMATVPTSTDTLSPAARSERMARVRGKDTKPELLVRERHCHSGLLWNLWQGAFSAMLRAGLFRMQQSQ